MALQYFRRHRKYFMALMLLAVFAMVTFGALYYGPQAWDRIKYWITGKNPYDPAVLVVYGKDVTRSQWWTVRRNLEAGFKFRGLANELMRRGAFREGLVLVRGVSANEMPNHYARVAMAQGVSDEQREENTRTVVRATVALLREAEQAGIVVDNEMVRDRVIREWEAAGIGNEILRILMASIFEGHTEWLYSMLRQELTLSIYLETMSSASKVFQADVDEEFRRNSETATIQRVSLLSESFVDRVAEPTEDEIKTQFEKYKDVLPTDPDSPFGYKIPNRIEFKYLKVDAKAVEADQEITDEEIKQYYELNKDPRYVIEPEPKKDTGSQGAKPPPETKDKDATNGDAPATTPDDADKSAPAATGETPDEKPAGDEEPAKVLDAPEAAPTGDAPESAQPAETSRETAGSAGADEATVDAEPAAEAGKSDEAAAQSGATGGAATPAAGDADKDKPEAAKAPEKQFKPLDEVREEIKTLLLRRRVSEVCGTKAREALDALMLQPSLSLENVAEGPHVEVYRSKGLMTQNEARELAGLGESFRMSADRRNVEKFEELAFSIAPLAEKPMVYLKRPVGVLIDAPGNRYIFTVTRVQPAHVAASLDEVRDRVVDDLKKVAAYVLAEKEAETLMAEAAAKDFAELAKERKLDVETRSLTRGMIPGDKDTVDRARSEFKVAEEDLELAGTRGDERQVEMAEMRLASALDRLMAATVFEAIDAEAKVGKLGSDASRCVTVFFVKDMEYMTEAKYREMRENLVSSAIARRQQAFRQEYTVPERIIRRSGVKRTDAPLEWRQQEEE